ncbi:TPA: hypothetical protein HA270_05005 [Candidatus Woesearchaeota archaeon]|nr:hypothetical protein [Candidatus Woesearchaeota archaeon]
MVGIKKGKAAALLLQASDGKGIGSIYELADSIRMLDFSMVTEHLKDEVAAWIRENYADSRLAGEILAAETKDGLLLVIDEKIAEITYERIRKLYKRLPKGWKERVYRILSGQKEAEKYKKGFFTKKDADEQRIEATQLLEQETKFSSDIRKQIHDLRYQKKLVEMEIEFYDSRLERLKVKLREKEQGIKEGEARNNAIEIELKKARLDLDVAMRHLEEKEKDLNYTQSFLERRERELIEKERDINEKAEAVHDMEEEHKKLAVKYDAAVRKAEKKSSAITLHVLEKKKELAELQNKAEKADYLLEARRKELDEHQAQLKRREEELTEKEERFDLRLQKAEEEKNDLEKVRVLNKKRLELAVKKELACEKAEKDIKEKQESLNERKAEFRKQEAQLKEQEQQSRRELKILETERQAQESLKEKVNKESAILDRHLREKQDIIRDIEKREERFSKTVAAAEARECEITGGAQAADKRDAEYAKRFDGLISLQKKLEQQALRFKSREQAIVKHEAEAARLLDSAKAKYAAAAKEKKALCEQQAQQDRKEKRFSIEISKAKAGLEAALKKLQEKEEAIAGREANIWQGVDYANKTKQQNEKKERELSKREQRVGMAEIRLQKQQEKLIHKSAVAKLKGSSPEG